MQQRRTSSWLLGFRQTKAFLNIGFVYVSQIRSSQKERALKYHVLHAPVQYLCDADCLPRAGKNPRDRDILGEVVEIVRLEIFGRARARHQLLPFLINGKDLDGGG